MSAVAAPGRSVITQSGRKINSNTGQVEFDRNNFGPPDIDPSELTYIKKIGGGCFGNVYEGECRGLRVAIKKLFKQDLNDKSLEEFRKEVEVCSRLNHPNVLLFMGACTHPGEMAIVTELCDRGNLETLLHNKDTQLSLYRRMVMAKEAAVGMAWLHGADPQIVHRDLKPSNLLVDKHGQVKVCDFGLSAIKPMHEKLQVGNTIPGTPLWMPPEVMMGRQVSEKADVYSYGMVLWEIATQQIPFPEMKSFPKFRQAVCLNNVRPPTDSIELPSLRDLIDECWHREATSRPSFSEIIRKLDSILVDCAIKDPTGRQFWAHEHPGKEFVLFQKEFLPSFLRHYELNSPEPRELECLKALAVTQYKDSIMKPVDVVRIEDFGNLLENFGPVTLTRVRKTLTETITIFDRMYRTCKNQWFHGDISKEVADSLLRCQREGTYLVRLSSTVSGCFTISRVTPNKAIHHHRIDYRGVEGFSTRWPRGQILSAPNKSLRSFINLLKEDMHLEQACPGSKFRVIFAKPQVPQNSCSGIYDFDENEEFFVD